MSGFKRVSSDFEPVAKQRLQPPSKPALRGQFLVTGASGFVGGHLVHELLRSGVSVRAMVRDAGKGEELREQGAEVVVGELRDPDSLHAAVDDVTGVFHIASLFRQAEFPEEVFHDINAEGTRRLLDAAITAGVSRFIHCSTGGVLGNIEEGAANEDTPTAPGDAYQRSKVRGEQIALEYMREGRIRGIVIRPGMIWGPRDTRNLKLFKMISSGFLFLVGDGRCLVHFVDVRDLCRAFVLGMQNDECSGEIYMIAGSRPIPFRDLASLIGSAMGRKPRHIHLPVAPMQWLGSACEAICMPLRIPPPIFRRRVDFFTKNRQFDWSKANRDLGYEPGQSLEDEVADIVGWYRERGWI